MCLSGFRLKADVLHEVGQGLFGEEFQKSLHRPQADPAREVQVGLHPNRSLIVQVGAAEAMLPVPLVDEFQVGGLLQGKARAQAEHSAPVSLAKVQVEPHLLQPGHLHPVLLGSGFLVGDAALLEDCLQFGRGKPLDHGLGQGRTHQE